MPHSWRSKKAATGAIEMLNRTLRRIEPNSAEGWGGGDELNTMIPEKISKQAN